MEALSALCDELIRPEPPPSHFVGLFVQLSPWRPQACSWVWKRLYCVSIGLFVIISLFDSLYSIILEYDKHLISAKNYFECGNTHSASATRTKYGYFIINSDLMNDVFQ